MFNKRIRTSVASILGENSRMDEFLQENYNDSNLQTQASDVQPAQSNRISNENFLGVVLQLIVKKFIEKCEDLAQFNEENELIQPDNSNYTVGKILLKCRSIVCSFDHSTHLEELLEEQQKEKLRF
ncbi:hypothetical protein BpHYR1_040577 [Brachionus plicatilis]|uniref:Uncharacterized protein n=1 Tax=Brachionus plicatilis TaxID=10195 RepID=A0A3M7RGY1_BRAPC|nr:hypothetical protein BpHYR1_040577 [Brachionus plicatilis]